MNKNSLYLILSLGLLFLLAACGNAEADTAPIVYDAAEDAASGLVIADGELVPEKDVQLVFEANGTVAKVLVEEGQTVQAGDVLFQLEAQENLLAELENAKLEQIAAQQTLDDLFLYADQDKNMAYQNLLDARLALNLAEAALDNFDEDAYDDDLETAKEEIADAKQALEDAEDDLADYSDLDEDNTARKSREDAVKDAKIDLKEAERERDEIKLERDQVYLNLELAEANLTAAETEFNKRDSGPDMDNLAAAEQRLAAANAAVDALNAAIENLSVTAPFSGTIAVLYIDEGDFVHAGQTAGLLADFSTWYVETTDLNELEVVRINEGDPVSVELDAFPGETLTGSVLQIDQAAVMQHGDVTYPTRIQLDASELSLRWKMSVIVTFTE